MRPIDSLMRSAALGLVLVASMLSGAPASGLSSQSIQVPLELASPFVDGAILQRGMDVPVWGWAQPGSQVTVSFAGQSHTAAADEMGKWRATLNPLEASHDERELTVQSRGAGEHGAQNIKVSGVLVGEVWFSSGQSNMDWIAGKSMCRDLANKMQRSQEDLPVREYMVDSGSALFLRSRAESAEGWKKAKQAGGFSALSLAFAWELYQELNVPIGILRSTHGATGVEPWTAYEGFAAHPDLQHIAERIRQSDPGTSAGQAAYKAFYTDLQTWQRLSGKLVERGGEALKRPLLPGIGDDWKGASRMYNKKIAPLIPYAIRGVIWCQGTHNANDGRIYAAKMEALVNGWRQNWGRPDLPFYFTQMQCYGEANADNVGFADIREAQRLFFMNADRVGMVLQHDLNPSRPTGIHYYNKLDPGKRLARWALAHEYGKDIAYTGPIYQSHSISGNAVRVQFEQRGPGGGLMVASKGLESAGLKDPAAYVEPARETPGEALEHFRLAGKDRVWHAAEASIVGDEVLITAPAVSEPIGVQYAYSASPIGANLYNQAGLPATPFAYFDGEQLFLEDDPLVIAEALAKTAAAQNPAPKPPFLSLAPLFRNHMVIQRNTPVPVWGFALPGTEVSVTFGGQTKTAVAGEFEHWQLTLDSMPAATEGRELHVSCSNGPRKTVADLVVGDVWVITGRQDLSSQLVVSRNTEGAELPPPMPLLREFRIKTKARRFVTPRKRRFEVGGGKYVASWQPALLADPYVETTIAAYHFAAQVQQEGVPIGILTLSSPNPPLTWISYEGMQSTVGFEQQRADLNLLYPNTAACKAAVSNYIADLEQYNRQVLALRAAGKELPEELAARPPVFPQPYHDYWAKRSTTATHSYNFCISPLTPMAVSGVLWIPGEESISDDASQYAPAVKAYAASLPLTYGQEDVPFVYAQPAAALVEGLGKPNIEDAVRLEFSEWPKSVRDIATQLGALVAEKRK